MPAKKPAKKREQRTSGSRKASGAKRAAADRAVKKAQDAGAVGPHVLGFQRQARDIAIIAQLTAGVTRKDAGAKLGVAERTVRTIEKQYRERSSALEKLPMEIVEGLVRDYQALIADFQFAAVVFCDNPAAYIAAKRQVRDTMNDFVTLLDALGKLPSNLEAFVQTERLRTMARRMAELVEQVIEGEVPPVQLRTFLLELAQPQTPGTRRELPPTA